MVRFYTDNLSITCLGGEILYFNKMLHNPEIVKMAEAGWWVVQIHRSSFYTLSIYIYRSNHDRDVPNGEPARY